MDTERAGRVGAVVTAAVMVLGLLALPFVRPAPAAAQAAAGPAGTFRAVTPARLLDTRAGTGGTRVGPRGTLHLQVLGRGGVPAGGVSAVLLSLVATDATAGGYVTAWADGTARPGTSNVNFRAGATVSDQATVRVGTDGRVALYNGSAGSVDLVADVFGYTAAGAVAPGAFVATTPARLADSRTTGSTAAHATLRVPVTGRGGVPASGVGAVALTVTAVGPAAPGGLVVAPSGGQAPPQPSVSFAAGDTHSGATVVVPGADGAVTVTNDSAGTAGLLVDVVGWFAAGSAGPAGRFVPVPPTPVPLTGSPIPARNHVSFEFPDVVPDHRPAAVLLAVTVTGRAAGYLTPGLFAYNDSRPVPHTSALTMPAGTPTSGLVVVPLATSGDGDTGLWNGAPLSATATVSVLGFFPRTDTGGVTGQVVDAASGRGLGGVEVRLYDPDPDMAEEFGDVYGYAVTAADGRYTISGVQAGGYAACFDADTTTGGPQFTLYARQCFRNQPYVPFDSPTVVPVNAGATTPGVDAALASFRGGSVTGTVTGAGGVPVAGARVTAGAVSTVTASDGRYRLDQLPAARLAVSVDPGDAHDDGAPYGYLPATTDRVRVRRGAVTTGVDVTLAPQNRIVGRLTSASGARFGSAYVEVFDVHHVRSYYGEVDTGDGAYAVTGLPAGTYVVCFHGEKPVTSPSPAYDWADVCADGVGWPTRFHAPPGARRITLGGGSRQDVDTVLDPAGTVSGTIRTPEGDGVGNAEIDVFDATSHELLRTANSESDGRYVIRPGLAASATGYLVCANGTLADRGSVCYPDVPVDGTDVPAGATPVPVPVGAAHGGVDITLPPA